MKVRSAIMKMVAVTTGLSMVGATIFGAAAADLSEYPKPLFIKDGKFDGFIVVGDSAAASDVIGSIDIATALQAESVVEEVPAGGGVGLYGGGIGQVATSGDVAEMAQPNDLLEIEERLGDVREVLTELDLNALRGGVVTTDEGTTDYNQYLRFEERSSGTDSFNTTLRVTYKEDEDDNVGDFLYSPEGTNNIIFEWEMEFEEGAESSIVSTSELDDLEDEIINVLGTPFAIADTDIDTVGSEVTIEMLGGAISDIMEEGETKTYTINGKEYEVNVLIVSDNRQLVKFKINGEITDELRDGETDILKDGTRIGIREILPNEAEEVTGGDLVEFYLGATEVEFQDNFSDQNFVRNVEVNDESIEDGLISIRGRMFSNNRKFELLTLKYRLEADTLLGDLFVPPGHGIREYLDEPEAMLSPNWDIVYGGLMDTGVSILKFDASGDDEYDIRFTSMEGLNYNFEFLDNAESTGFRIGDDDDNLIWIEPDNSSDYIVAQKSQVVLTDDNDETGFTHIVEYQSYDEGDNELTFTDLAGETREFTAESISGEYRAELIFGGNTFIAYVNATASGGHELAMDMNNDGLVGDNSATGDGDTETNNYCDNTGSSAIVGLSINSSGGILDANSVVNTADPVGPCRAAVVIQGGGVLDLGVCDGLNPPGANTARANTNSGRFRCGAQYNASGTANGDLASSIGATGNTVMRVGLKTLASEFDEDGPRDQGGDEVVVLDIVNRTSYELGLSVRTTAPPGRGSDFNLQLEELKENDDISREMTDYGALLELFNPAGGDDAEDLTIEYPLVQRGAHVFIVAGEYGIETRGPGGVSQRVVRINVGAAKLASEVEDVTAVNAVVVGGPCANTAAADLMGNPDDCAAGFKEGQGLIKLYENGGKVAVLVAGYGALDTRRAARVLANYGDYDLTGKEVTVSGTSLTDIRVTKATV